MYTGDRVSMSFFRFESELDVNALDDENVVLQFYLADGFRDQPFIRGIDVTRFQRASEGSSKSTRRRCDHIVQSGSVRLEHVGGDFIVLGHRAMNAENHRLRFRGQVRSADGTFHAFDANIGPVDHFRHPNLLAIPAQRLDCAIADAGIQ